MDRAGYCKKRVREIINDKYETVSAAIHRGHDTD